MIQRSHGTRMTSHDINLVVTKPPRANKGTTPGDARCINPPINLHHEYQLWADIRARRTGVQSPPPINHHSNRRTYTVTNAQNNWSHEEDEGTTRGALHGSSKGGKPHESVVAPLAYGEQAEVGVHSEVSLTLSTIRRYQASKGGHEQPAMLCERVC